LVKSSFHCRVSCHHHFTDKEGFIHLSTAEQVASTANRIFKNQSDLLLLHVDTTKLPQPLKYELAEPNLPPFPHLYCELPLDAVTHVQELKAGEDGLFRFL
jgi:uncharacterized protein (DUF952 family)